MPVNSVPVAPPVAQQTQNTFFDYLISERSPLRKKPFGTEDSILLTQLAYLCMGGFVKGFSGISRSVSIKRLAKPKVLEELCRRVNRPEEGRKLMLLAADNPRFSRMRVKFYSEHTDEAADKQFAAMTFLLDDRSAFIAFRGTDNSIVGWRENFMMAYRTPVPAQADSVGYLERAAKRLPFRRIRVGGHSKGGNLAVYAALNCGEDCQDRITDIYDLDGPGFKDSVLNTPEHDRIKSRINFVVPQESMIGTLLKPCAEMRVVKSSGDGFEQHSPLRWQIDGGGLVYVDKLAKGSLILDDALDNWLEGLSDEQRTLMVDVLFEVVNESNAENFDQVLEMIKSGEISALGVLRGLKSDRRRSVLAMLRSLGLEYIKSRISLRKQ